MVYFENEAAVVYCFPEKYFAVTYWKGFANSDNLREVLDQASDMIDKYTINYWLNDNRNMKVIRPSDQEYIASVWLQKIIPKAQIRKSATIESADTFNLISIDNILRKADSIIPFDRKDFSSAEGALEWLGIDVTEEELHGLYKN